MNRPGIDGDRSVAERPLRGDFDATLIHRNLFELFERQVELHRDKTAVIGPDRSLTYGELVTRAHGISRYLRQKGIAPEQPVGVFMQRTADVVAVLLGILHAGGCYVPLDPAEPAERARVLAVRADLAMVLGDETMLALLRDAIDHPEATHRGDDARSGRGVELVDVAPVVNASDGAAVESDGVRCAPGDERLAYIMYTSGSTGAPKGVEVEHRNVINLLLAAAEAFAFTETDRYLAVSTLAFDISVVEVFLPLILGGSVVLGDRPMLLEPGGVAAAIVRHDVTVFQTGPSVWSLLLGPGIEFPHLRVAITTGEATAPALARRLVSIADLVWNLYGPTETTIWCTGQRIDAPSGLDECTPVAAPLGYMWPNMPGIIVDESGELVADGEQGDLWVGGLAVTRGYKDNVGLTDERYVRRPGDPDRYYRTGDVVSRAPSGVLRFFGRNDDQVQVHGVRIEPMEVESAVREDPCVDQAAATWFVNEFGAHAIVAGVVAKTNAPTRSAELHARLAKALPSAMVPSRFVFYDALPLTPNGKTDRLAIRADATGSIGADDLDAVAEDLTPTERALHDIWAATLRRSRIGRHDNFFAIGGDSLAAVAMVLDAQDEFGVSLSVPAVIESPTLHEFARHIDRSRQAGSHPTTDPRFTFQLVRGDRGNPVFFCAIELNLAGQGQWRLDCPLYSVNYWTMGRGFSRASSLEDLAARHVADIKAVQPLGPYRIAGFSFGGIVALEIAQQLRRQGDAIELLFLLDPTEPYRTGDTPTVLRIDGVDQSLALTREHHERFGPRLLRHARHIVRDRSAIAPYVKERVRLAPVALFGHTKVWPWAHYRLIDLHGRFPNRITAKLLPEDRWIGFWYVAKRFAQNYVAVPFDGPTLAVFLEQNERLGSWRKLLAESADVRVIQGRHDDLNVEPTLTEWMEMLIGHLQPTGQA